MTERNLSDGLSRGINVMKAGDTYIPNQDVEFILVSDVKEFIRRLKELSLVDDEPNEYGFHLMHIPIEVFHKLAGEKLL